MERSAGPTAAGDTPNDAHGRVNVPDAPGRQYLAVHGHAGDAPAIEFARLAEVGEMHGRDGKTAEPIGLPRPSAARGRG